MNKDKIDIRGILMFGSKKGLSATSAAEKIKDIA